MGATRKTTTAPVVEEPVVGELNLDTKVTVRNIAGWTVGFSRIADGYGDVTITPNGSTRLSRNEIISQIQNGNKLFLGTDEHGSHATLIIEDKPTRMEVDFETETTTQNIFSEKKISDLFNERQTSFETKLVNEIRTRAEKYAAMVTIKKLKLNDYSKIRFVERYTGYKLEAI